MTEAVDVLNQMRGYSFQFVDVLVDWVIDSPIPFIFVCLFIAVYIVRCLKRLM